MRERMVAALYVEPGGPYYGLDGVEPWGPPLDAREYRGPWPVVAHPPCERWGRYWSGGPSAHGRFRMGDDDGMFEAALNAVRRWGGVLEHPEASHAWRWFGLKAPPRDGGWVAADFEGGWTCCVEQGHYGHRARKATWLYAAGVRLPSLKWGESKALIRPADGLEGAALKRALKTGACQRMSRKERRLTPEPFRDALIAMARTAHA